MAAAVPYLIIGAVGLIGEWLLGPKSKADKTQPGQMPSLNQALRGSPIFVTFGADRVSAQVTWTKNWQAVRQKGGGKGAKGGGSGGMGSAKGGGAAGQSYNYFWDMIFHFGFVDQPSIITRAWVGGDQVNDATVKAWANGVVDGGVSLPLFAYAATQKSAENTPADLTATEFFYAPGYITGDANLETWPYFQSQEGLRCQWPSTAWLGFNKLALGQSPAIPQLSVELMPFNAGSAWTPNFEVLRQQTELQTAQIEPFLRDEAGNLYAFGWDQGGSTSDRERAAIFPMSDPMGKTVVLNSQFDADRATLSLTATANEYQATVFIPDTPYFYIAARHSTGSPHPTLHYIAVLYKVETDGSITRQGGFEYASDPPDGGTFGHDFTRPISVRRMADGSVKYVHIANGAGGPTDGTRMHIHTLPDPALLLGTNTDVQISGTPGAYKWQALGVEVTTVGASFLSPGSYRESALARCGIVEAIGGVICYFGEAEMQWANDHTSDTFFCQYLKDNYTGHEGGMLVKVDFAGGVTIINAYDTDGTTPLIPMADRQLDSTGGAGDATDDYGPFEQGGDYIGWGRSFSDDSTKVRVKMFTVVSGKLQLATTVQGIAQTIAPTETELQYCIPYISPVTNDLFVAMSWDGHGANPGTIFSDFAAFTGDGIDLTPPYIIKRILTSPLWGFATSALFGFAPTIDTIDDTSYQDAVQKCVDEGIKLSVSYTNQDSLLTILNDLLALYGGSLAEHAGKIFFDVYRDTDVPIRTIDNSHLLSPGDGLPPVTVTKGAIQDGFNSVQYQYLARNLEYKQQNLYVSDEVDIDTNGYRNKVYNTAFVITGSVAQQVAERALWSNLYGRDNYDFKVGWKDADLRPGVQVTLVDSWHPTLRKGVKCVISNWNEEKRGEFTVKATRVFANHLTAQHGYTQTSSVDDGPGSIIETAQPLQDFRAYELPEEFQGADGVLYFGYNEASKIMGAQLFVSRDLGVSFAQVGDVQPYAISGRLASALPARDSGFMEQNVDLWLFPKPGFNVATPDFVQDFTLDDATPAARANGGTTIVVGSEAMAMEGLTLLGTNHYRVARLYRGWGGTPVSAQNSGSFFHEHGAGIFSWPITQDDIGTTIQYKIIGYNFAGRPYDVSSVDPRTYTITGLKWLPRIQTPIKLFVNSPVAWTNSVPFKGDNLAITSGGCDVVATWPAASNIEGFGAGGWGHSTFGHFAPDISSPTYRVDVASKNGWHVSSFVVNTGYFIYTVAQNSADFAGFAREVVYKVTPFTVKGDGPSTSIRSLNLFW